MDLSLCVIVKLGFDEEADRMKGSGQEQENDRGLEQESIAFEHIYSDRSYRNDSHIVDSRHSGGKFSDVSHEAGYRRTRTASKIRQAVAAIFVARRICSLSYSVGVKKQ